MGLESKSNTGEGRRALPVKIYDFKCFELIKLGIPMFNLKEILHVPLYMHLIAHIPNGVSISLSDIEIRRVESDHVETMIS